MKTITTTTTEMFRPSYDPTIGRPFTGCHSGYMVIAHRKGDTVEISEFGEKGWNPCRPLIKKETYSISRMIADLKESVSEFCNPEFIDDLPEGSTIY